MRAASLLAIGTSASLALAAACSLFVPFDEYGGSEGDGAAPLDAAPLDGADADGDAGEDAGGACDGVDLKTDPGHCGACGRRCSGGGACEAGRCPVEPVVVEETGTVSWLSFAPAAGDGGDLPVSYTHLTLPTNSRV